MSFTAIKVTQRDQLQQQVEHLCNRILGFWDFTVPLKIDYGIWADAATTGQRKLYWAWMEALAGHFSNPGKSFSKDDMHDLMKHEHLGYEDKTIGHTVISRQLKSTSPSVMGKGSMSEYMTKIDAWAADHGVLLPRPEDNEYTKYRDARK
jgi:hypothetical protein